MTDYKVLFLPNKNEITVSEVETIISATISAGVYTSASCGGKRICSKYYTSPFH